MQTQDDGSDHGFEMIEDFSKLNRRSEHIRMSHATVKDGKKIKKFHFHKPIYDTRIKIGEI